MVLRVGKGWGGPPLRGGKGRGARLCAAAKGCSREFQGACYHARRVVFVATPPFQRRAGEHLWFVVVLVASAMCFNMTEKRSRPGP